MLIVISHISCTGKATLVSKAIVGFGDESKTELDVGNEGDRRGIVICILELL